MKCLCSASFSNPYITSHTSQLILQPFRRFTYVTAHSTVLPLIHLRHRHFTYVTVHSPTLPALYIHHSSFYNPSVASPTSQLILPPFRRFIYATAHSTTLPPFHLRHRSFYNPSVASPTSQALHVLHLASRPCIGDEKKNSLWWTSLLQQVTKFRSSYIFG